MDTKKYLNFFAFIFFRLRSHRASLTFSKAKMTKTKVILIEVTTWTQAVGRARNLKSKTIEIGCSNKKKFHSEGKSEKSYWAMKCNKYQTLVYVCVYCYICQTNVLDFFKMSTSNLLDVCREKIYSKDIKTWIYHRNLLILICAITWILKDLLINYKMNDNFVHLMYKQS